MHRHGREPRSARRNSLSETQKGFEQRQKIAAALLPDLQVTHPAGQNCPGRGVEGVQAARDLPHPRLAGLQLRLDLVGQQPAQQRPQFHHGFVMLDRPATGMVIGWSQDAFGHGSHGADFAQKPQALADRAFADMRPRLDVGKGQGQGRRKQDAVDHRHRLGHAEQIGRLDKQRRDFVHKGPGGVGRRRRGSRVRGQSLRGGIRFKGH